jgi:serine/threonine protein kinase
MFYNKWKKYNNKKNSLIGGTVINALDDDPIIEWKKTEFISFNNDEYVRIKNIGKGSYGDVYLYVNEHGNQIVVKDFGESVNSEKNFNKEKKIYDILKQKNIHHMFPQSKFYEISYDGEYKYYLIMENLYNINPNYIISNYHILIDYIKQIAGNINILLENEMYYTDLKLSNMMVKDGKYYLIDYGSICYPPEFDCEVTYIYIDENMESKQDIKNIDFNHVKNAYASLLRESQISPLEQSQNSPLMDFQNQPLSPILKIDKLEYYLTFLIWNLINDLFNPECSYIYYHQSIHAIKNFDETKKILSNCKISVLTQIENLMDKSNINNIEKKKIHNLFKMIAYGKINNISYILDSLYNIDNNL